MPSKTNSKQDEEIAKLGVKFDNLKEMMDIKIDNITKRFDTFICNDFEPLRQRVDWILWIFILGTLCTILLNLFSK